MKKIFPIALFLVFLSFEASAQNARETSFDQRPACEEAKGVWREFGNGCVDQCRPKLDHFAMCTQAIENGCDCGKSRCWDGETCVALKDYKKLYDQELSEEKAVLEVAKKARKAKYRDDVNARLEDINKKAADKSIFDNSAWSSNRSEDQVKKPEVVSRANPKADPKPEPGPIALPPFFLQQEKAKQTQATPTPQAGDKNAAQANTDPNLTKPGNSGNAAKKDDSDLFKIPGLPDIPLPN